MDIDLQKLQRMDEKVLDETLKEMGFSSNFIVFKINSIAILDERSDE